MGRHCASAACGCSATAKAQSLHALQVGLPATTVSWGGDISNAQSILRTDPMVLFYPSAALAITVLAFIMMGDAVKDALDPKSRTA